MYNVIFHVVKLNGSVWLLICFQLSKSLPHIHIVQDICTFGAAREKNKLIWILLHILWCKKKGNFLQSCFKHVFKWIYLNKLDVQDKLREPETSQEIKWKIWKPGKIKQSDFKNWIKVIKKLSNLDFLKLNLWIPLPLLRSSVENFTLFFCAL